MGNGQPFVSVDVEQATADAAACDPSDFDASLDADVYGTVISGSASLNASVGNTYDPPFDCSCLYTADECTGTDIATCRSEDSCDMLFDEPCWGNDTDVSCDDDFSNETCWLDTVAAYPAFSVLLASPC